MEPGALLQIGEAADRVGLSIRTLRYWEEVGLLEPTARSKGGFRLYSDVDLERLLVLKAMKPMGFTLDEMRTLLELVDAAGRDVEGSDRDAVVVDLEAFGSRTEERIKRLIRDLGDAASLLESINRSIRRLSRQPVAGPR